MSLPELRIAFGGHELLLHAHGVIWWPGERTLIASDLHFEKSTFHAAHGNLLPPYDTQDTLQRLEELVAQYKPARLILLGDSFHDAQAWSRLDEMLRTKIAALAASVDECVWIEGNHDVALSAHPLGALRTRITIEGLTFAHDDSETQRPAIIGHYHPKVKVALGRRSAGGKCFIHSTQLLIMPSFGTYTGGLDIRHAAIRRLFVQEIPHIHLLYRGKLYPIPHHSQD